MTVACPRMLLIGLAMHVVLDKFSVSDGRSLIIGSVMFGTTETVFLLVYLTSWSAPAVKL